MWPSIQFGLDVVEWALFSMGRMSNVVPHATRNPQRFTGSIIQIAENPPPPPERVTITILNDHTYNWKGAWGRVHLDFAQIARS